MNPAIVIDLLIQFLDLLQEKYGHRFKCILWYQQIQPDIPKIEIAKSKEILVCEFFTREECDGDELWNGSSDHDLFSLFFEHETFKSHISETL